MSTLRSLADEDPDYWTFRRAAARRRAHGLTQYPAMMVPPMQAVLMDVVSRADGHVEAVVDPFLGSGTTLVESMRLGLDFAGQDINPLAILFSRTKAGPFHVNRLSAAAAEVASQASADRSTKPTAEFPGIDKWFESGVVTELSRLRRAIRLESNLWCRRVLWTAMAEVVRLTSNSRTSTFKLHVRRSDELANRHVSPIQTFRTILAEIVDRLRDEAAGLKEMGHLSRNGHYRGNARIRLGDSSHQLPGAPKPYDLLVTSPPYGDNTSTVPYGQYSYLPLQWIDLQDIDGDAGPEYIRTTYEIDRRSLGGVRTHESRGMEEVLGGSPSLRATLRRLERFPPDRSQRVASFCRDLMASLQPMLDSLRPQGYMIWTVGNRRVGGAPVPTDAILEELLSSRGANLIMTINRSIPNKRMAPRNNIASTMRGETVLLFRKA